MAPFFLYLKCSTVKCPSKKGKVDECTSTSCRKQSYKLAYTIRAFFIKNSGLKIQVNTGPLGGPSSYLPADMSLSTYVFNHLNFVNSFSPSILNVYLQEMDPALLVRGAFWVETAFKPMMSMLKRDCIRNHVKGRPFLRAPVLLLKKTRSSAV